MVRKRRGRHTASFWGPQWVLSSMAPRNGGQGKKVRSIDRTRQRFLSVLRARPDPMNPPGNQPSDSSPPPPLTSAKRDCRHRNPLPPTPLPPPSGVRLHRSSSCRRRQTPSVRPPPLPPPFPSSVSHRRPPPVPVGPARTSAVETEWPTPRVFPSAA